MFRPWWWWLVGWGKRGGRRSLRLCPHQHHRGILVKTWILKPQRLEKTKYLRLCLKVTQISAGLCWSLHVWAPYVSIALPRLLLIVEGMPFRDLYASQLQLFWKYLCSPNCPYGSLLLFQQTLTHNTEHYYIQVHSDVGVWKKGHLTLYTIKHLKLLFKLPAHKCSLIIPYWRFLIDLTPCRALPPKVS